MIKGKAIAYKRVSTPEQNPARQLEGIEFDKEFVEYASGRSVHRPVLNQLIEYVREDDMVYVHSMDRLARNSKDLRDVIDKLISKGASVHFRKESLTFKNDNSSISMLMLGIMGAIAEFEGAMIHERLMEGISAAKKRGVYKKRKRKMNDEKIEQMKKLLQTRKPKTKIALELGITTMTLYKYIKECKLNIE